MSITYKALKDMEAELPARINGKHSRYPSLTVTRVEIEPISGTDVYYTDGDARFYACWMTIHTTSPTAMSSRRIAIFPSGTHTNPWGYADPVVGKALDEALDLVLFELNETGAAKFTAGDSPVAGTAPTS